MKESWKDYVLLKDGFIKQMMVMEVSIKGLDPPTHLP